MPGIYQIWDVEAGVSQGVYQDESADEAFAQARLDADEEGRVGPTEGATEVRLLSAVPVDEHDEAEVGPLVLRRFRYGRG
jgi:hypothetical protein